MKIGRDSEEILLFPSLWNKKWYGSKLPLKSHNQPGFASLYGKIPTDGANCWWWKSAIHLFMRIWVEEMNSFSLKINLRVRVFHGKREEGKDRKEMIDVYSWSFSFFLKVFLSAKIWRYPPLFHFDLLNPFYQNTICDQY